MELWIEDQLRPLPTDFAWERFGTQERRVSWEGFISSEGVLSGFPSHPSVAGALVLVGERERQVRIFHQGQLVVTLQKRPRSQEIVLHPDQFQHVAPVASLRQAARPLGHQIDPPQVAIRSLTEYDHLFGLQVQG